MAKELKFRIRNPKDIEKKLLDIGAKFTGESTHFYTYLRQLDGKVLKVTKNNKGTYKTRLERKDGKWEIVENTPVTKEQAENLERENDVKRKMENKRRFYAYKDFLISLNSFPDIGDFLIMEAEDPQIEFIADELGIKNPEIITVSFDNL